MSEPEGNFAQGKAFKEEFLAIAWSVDILRDQAPDLKVRVINVVDLMTLQPKSENMVRICLRFGNGGGNGPANRGV